MAETHLGLKKLQGRFPTLIMNVKTFRGETTVSIPKDRVLEICRFLYSDSDLQFHVLTDLCGVDFYPQDPRFEMIYLLYSMKNNFRLRVKTKVAEGESIPSVESVWKAANWLEREVYDLFGIVFENHPDLRRILLWDGFEGHPLRKDFPVEGPDFDKPFVPEV
jgi:NADH-quinone oxidoreductase subunit C